MILLGLISGIILARKLSLRTGENPEHVLNIAVFGTATALIGARLYHVFDQDVWPRYRAQPIEIFQIWDGGIGIFGAILGALAGLLIYARWRKLESLRWLDIGAPAFLLGQAVGRWGNFFNQELFGGPTSLPWGIPIPQVNVLREAPRFVEFERFHPLFLYESVLSLIGVVFLVFVYIRFGPVLMKRFDRKGNEVTQLTWKSKIRLRQGDLLLLYFIWYPCERFVLEFVRAGKWEMGVLPMAQWISGALVLAAGAALIGRHFTPNGANQDIEAPFRRSRSSVRRQSRRSE